MDAPSLRELEPQHRRRLVIGAAVASVAISVSLLVVYYLAVPSHPTNGTVLIGSVTVLVTLVASILLAARFVTRATYPVLRLVPALALVAGTAVVGFASTYLLLSADDTTAFSEPLGHTDALYFTITTSTTIGYGDITPVTERARIVVMVHMFTNVVVVGVGVRALVHAARRRSTW